MTRAVPARTATIAAWTRARSSSSLSAEDELVHVRDLPARTTEPGPFPAEVPDLIRQRLALVGVTGLYEHQRAAFDLARSGGNVIVATGTASGKTLVYNLAFAAAAVPDPKRTALYLFPTKALARDQLRQVRELRLPQLRAAVYDGDTPRADRPLIRRNANLVHDEPGHAPRLDPARTTPRWADFFLRLSHVVVDEAPRRSAACSARTSRTSCGGSGGWWRTTAATPRSCSRPRPSATRSSSPNGSSGSRSRPSSRTARRAGGRPSRCGTRRSWTRSRALAAARSPRPRS